MNEKILKFAPPLVFVLVLLLAPWFFSWSGCSVKIRIGTSIEGNKTTPDTVYVRDTTFTPVDTTSHINEEDLIHAIMMVESRGNPKAYNKSGATGCMQIMPVMLAEVNRINRILKNDKYFYPNDRWDCDKSVEMFLIWKNFHHKDSDFETISRHWWGGPKYGEMDCSLFYWERVKGELEKQS